jgi:hypothetical protein
MLLFVCLCVRNAIILYIVVGDEILFAKRPAEEYVKQIEKMSSQKSTAKFMYLMVAYRLIVFLRFCSRGLALLL